MADDRQLKLILKLQDEATKELKKISAELGSVNKEATKASGGFMSFGKSILGVAAAFLSVQKIMSSAKLGLTIAADLETAEVGLTTLTGSAEEAAQTVERLKLEAKRTPFELPGLTRATQLLTAVTKDGDESIDILLDVGEALAAMGKGQSELDRIIVNLQQIAAVGKASTLDIKQFAFAGIPIYELLAETTGKTGEALGDMITEGQITFDLLTTMFDKANDEGGKFFNAYVNQAGTYNQATSNMMDSWQIFLSDIVKASGLFDAAKEAMIGVSDWLGNWEENVASLRSDLADFMNTLEDNTGLVSDLTEAWEKISKAFDDDLRPALMDLWESFKPYIPFLIDLAKIIGGVLLISLKGMIVAFGEIIKWSSKVFAGIIRLSALFLDGFKPVIDGAKIAVGFFIDFIKEMVNVLDKAGEILGWITDKVLGFIGATQTATDQVVNMSSMAEQSYMSIASSADNMSMAVQSYAGEIDTAAIVSAEFGDEAEETFNKASSGAGKATDEAKKLAEEYKKVTDNIEDLKTKLSEVFAEQARAERDIRKDFANAWIEQEENIADLKRELEEKKLEFAKINNSAENQDRRSTAQEQIRILEDTISKEVSALESKRGIEEVFEQEIADIRAFNALTDFEQTLKTIELKMIKESEAFNVKISNIKKEIIAEEAKANSIIETEGIIADATIELSNSSSEVVIANFNAEANAAEAAAIRIINARSSFSSGGGMSLAPVQSLMPIQSVNDAIIDPSGRIISTAPDDYLIATKDPGSLGGSGVNVFVTVEGDVSGQDLVEKVKEAFMTELKQNTKLVL